VSPRAIDPVWEALVEETQAVPEVERGPLNVARKAIIAASTREGILPEDLPNEIRVRAKAYRLCMGDCTLTPMALAKHWRRVVGPSAQTSEQAAFTALRSASHGNVTL
jgi:hypothetical protein